MARALWSGAISFGLVNVPVKLFKATSSGSARSISFHQIHSVCGTRIQHVRRCPHCEREVPWEEVAKGYEVSKGRYAVLTEEDFAGLPTEDKAAIAIEDFVVESEIDPMLYDTSYYVAPDGPPRPYGLLHRALADSGKVAVARMMLRTRSHLCVVRAAEGRLLLETVYFADEVIDPAAIPGLPADLSLPAREVQLAEKLIDAMTAHFDPSKYRDVYTESVRKIIEKKIAGEEVTEAPAEVARPSGVIDLAEALRRSMAAIGKEPEHPARRSATATKAKAKAAGPSRAHARHKKAG